MGLRCLLGHDFSEPELRREREEDGNEVVTTVTEVKTCARCGETQVVSENTEVTTMAQLADEAAAGAEAAAPESPSAEPDADGDDRAATDDVGPDSPSTGTGATGAETADAGPTDAGAVAASTEAGADADGDDAVIIDDEPAAPADDGIGDEVASGEPAGAAGGDGAAADEAGDGTATDGDEGAEVLEPEAAADEAGPLGGGEEYAEYPEVETAESPAEDESEADADDGVILDEEAEPATDRERGAWPEVDEADGSGATAPWPEQRGEDEGFSAEVGEGGAGDVEFGGGLTPEAAEQTADDGDAEYVEAPDRDADEVGGTVESRDDEAGAADAGTEITRAESPDLSTSTAEATTEYHCPECGMSRDADGNSMRAGDICPECKRGYVTERPV